MLTIVNLSNVTDYRGLAPQTRRVPSAFEAAPVPLPVCNPNLIGEGGNAPPSLSYQDSVLNFYTTRRIISNPDSENRTQPFDRMKVDPSLDGNRVKLQERIALSSQSYQDCVLLMNHRSIIFLPGIAPGTQRSKRCVMSVSL